MEPLRFRAPGVPLAAEALLQRVLPHRDAAARRRVLAEARLRRAGPDFRPGRPLRAGERVPPGEACCLEGEAPPPGEPPEPAYAWCPRLAWPAGEAEAGAGARFRFAVVAERGALARVRIERAGCPWDAVGAWFERAGAPLVGDLRHGGVAAGLAPFESEPGDAAEPAEPVFPDEAGPPPDLAISSASARALRRGHPWVLPDAATGDTGRFPPGALVLLRAGREALGLARVEGAPELAARVWALGVSRPREAPGVEARVARALARREALRARGAIAHTDAVRLVHGEADGLPGVAVDELGGRLRILVSGRAALGVRERLRAALRGQLAARLGPDPPMVEVVHLRHPPPGALTCAAAVGGRAEDGSDWVVEEAGLRFRVDPGLADPTRPRPGIGLFLDQRDNRARIAARARPDGRYLNLFAHTGAFSLALLRAGAGEVWSVDLSGPYLAQLEENLNLSGLAAGAHRSIRRDARRMLDELAPEERFDGIVLDPPTAAAAGRRFWDVRRGLGPLVRGALRRLAPGGFLLLSRNARPGAAGAGLEALVRAAAERAGVALASVEPAPPAPDFASPVAFPEGIPFEAFLLTRA